MLETLTRYTQERIESEISNHRLILFSPRLRTRNALLAGFIDAPGSYLYAVSSLDDTLAHFLQRMVEGLRDYAPSFGAQTLQALQARKPTPDTLADALIADLGKLDPAARFLVLDSFDSLTLTSDAVAFFEALLSRLPRDMHLVVNSRNLGYLPWSKFVRSGDAAVLGEQMVLDGGIFNPTAPESPQLEVYGFGGGHVFVDGVPLDTWDGPLPRNLFFYFIDHPMVTRDEIFETFWPGLPIKEATNVFHVTKRKVSERLGYELTGYSGGFYRASGQMALHYDVARFEQDATEALKNDSIEGWYKAIRLYRSEYLHNTKMPWVALRRERLHQTYATALISVGRIYKSLRESEKAIHFYLRALREVPEREDIHRDLMTIYEMRGERDKAIAQYVYLKDLLHRTLGISPSQPTRTLYAMLTGNPES